MKATVVPAQVTTVEDRVAGNLGFSQLILLALPVFGGALLYAVLPPSLGVSLYKIIIVVVFAIVCSLLAIRIKGKIVLLWVVILLHYNLRPKFYVFNKNTTTYREEYRQSKTTPKQSTKAHAQDHKVIISLPKLSFMETAEVYATLDDSVRNLRFETTKKGGLNVRLTEIEE